MSFSRQRGTTLPMSHGLAREDHDDQVSSDEHNLDLSRDFRPHLEARTNYAPAPAIVAIGISTGGPRALEQIMPRFPHQFPIPILIVQHMPRGFTGPLSERLNQLCSIRVSEAIQQQRLQPGTAYIAPAGRHMRVVRNLFDDEPMLLLDSHRGHSLHMPSVDLLMKSVAEIYRSSAIGVIMTGMGCDGTEGITAIFKAGGLTIGQDEASCTVYGMPRACAEAGVLTKVAPLSRIPFEIMHALQTPLHA